MSNELTPLEALKNIEKRIYGEIPETTDIVDDDLYIIEAALKERETPTETFEQFVGEPSEVIYSKLKAFDIIKKREVNVQSFKDTCLDMSYDTYKYMFSEGHFMGIMMTSLSMLSKEEFELLKKMLK